MKRFRTKLIGPAIVVLSLFAIVGFGPKLISKWADQKIEAAEQHRRVTSPVYLEHDNQFKRNRYFMECKSMPAADVDGPDTCVTEAFSLFPDRDWKKIAADNAAKGL